MSRPLTAAQLARNRFAGARSKGTPAQAAQRQRELNIANSAEQIRRAIAAAPDEDGRAVAIRTGVAMALDLSPEAEAELMLLLNPAGAGEQAAN